MDKGGNGGVKLNNVIHFRVDEKLYHKVKALADKRCITMSDVVRQILQLTLEDGMNLFWIRGKKND